MTDLGWNPDLPEGRFFVLLSTVRLTSEGKCVPTLLSVKDEGAEGEPGILTRVLVCFWAVCRVII